MTPPSVPPPTLLRQFALTQATHVATTDLAHVWKVTRTDGPPAALKLYHGETMSNEAHGFAMLHHWNGVGAARLYGQSRRAALLEWLDGPALGDLVRRGDDAEAAEHLVGLARRLHPPARHAPNDLPTLDDWFDALFALRVAAACPEPLRRDIRAATNLARGLLAKPRDVTALHGDLHHDNIRHGPRGWTAFDAKGVRGERCFEMANAFRNPGGAETLMREPARITFLADLWSARFGVARERLLRWAAAKCALSIAWRSGPDLEGDAEADLLSRLLAATAG